MSLKLEMLQVARLAPQQLGESSESVEQFLRGQLSSDGGFRDRAGQSDLYYTVFGIEGLVALSAELPVELLADYLATFGSGDELDFVHRACLARAWSSLPLELRNTAFRAERLLGYLEARRSADGGYAMAENAAQGTAYASFLALGAYQDLGVALPEPERLLGALDSFAAKDGGYGDSSGASVGLTPTTAAVVALRRQLGAPPEPAVAAWLVARFHRDGGGFFAGPGVPMPDLLSTATALHALDGLHAHIEPVKEGCLDFLDTLWSSEGGFYGHWADDVLDCEYTYYGLLALGHLSL